METDAELLALLRDGNESAFVALVERYQVPMLRLARSLVDSQAVAEEAVQDTWMGVVRGLERFEGRSSFKTWLFRILVNRARSARQHERRSAINEGPSVDPACFDGRGNWIEPVTQWAEEVDDRIDASAALPVLNLALSDLPSRQRQVVLLRDVEGLSSDEACSILGIQPGNQRILLHRGRARLRQKLAVEFKGV